MRNISSMFSSLSTTKNIAAVNTHRKVNLHDDLS